MSFDEHLYFDGAGSFTSAGIGSSAISASISSIVGLLYPHRVWRSCVPVLRCAAAVG